jgi:hypothetical protein
MPRKAKKRAPRVTRKLTAKMLQDLCRRLDEQSCVAEAFAARPRADTIAAAFPMLKVLELAAAEHARSLSSIALLAKITSERLPV